jgi:hypothetical protein
VTDPTAEPTASRTALPPVGARVLAFVLILLAGTAGGFIGYAFTDLQCEGDCGLQTGVGALVGALLGAGGVAVVTVLALRAMGEWKTIQEREQAAATAAAVAEQKRRPPRVR